MAEAVTQMEAQYCPPLDPALLSAILLDHDLGTERGVQDASNTLDQLKESALLEDAAGFDPSGTGAHDDGDDTTDNRAKSCPEESSATSSGETETTSISNGVSSLNFVDMGWNDDTPIGDPEELEMLDDEMKVRLLQDLFGDLVSEYDMKYTLGKCNGRWQAAMEELLNHVYFHEAGSSDGSHRIYAKGIDAFAEKNFNPRGRKGKTKRRPKAQDERRSSSLPMKPGGNATHFVNKWQSASKEVNFISSRMGIAETIVSSTYYAEGASVSKTIGALLKASMEESKYVVTDDAAVSEFVRELSEQFTTIAPEYLTTLVRLTYPSTATAHELAGALIAKPKDAGAGVIQIIPRYTSPPSSDVESSWQTAVKQERNSRPLRSSKPEVSNLAAQAAVYASARATAFSQASAAHRRARSDRFMSGVAGYYGEMGRDYAALASRASAAAADELAATQSTSSSLDLHGIDVLNAVRIARDNVEAWWENLGEDKVNGRVGAEERSRGFRIVVGSGTHSEGGKGKLKPAVSKALRQSGWRIEEAGAIILVKTRLKV